MNYKTLISKITEYTHLCTTELSKWLNNMLPHVFGDDWWENGVLSKLSINQCGIVARNKITSLESLDLSALLRIADKNWYSFRNRCYLKYSDRMTITKMFSVRNNWAHAPAVAPALQLIVNDLSTIKDFIVFLNVTRTIITELEKLIIEIKNTGISDINTDLAIEKVIKSQEKINVTTQISKDSIVRLISNPDTSGVVLGVEEIGNTLQYSVFIDGKQKKFFEGQIELIPHDEKAKFNGLSDVLRILTAYQIKKPSSDSLYSLNAARIDFVPYQFRPALKLIKSDVPRLLIADGVGVGKTIEAGLILKEMQARTSLDTVLIICPRPLVAEHKWEREMKRFDEDFTEITDGNMLREIIRETNRDGEWPNKYKRLIIPYSLLKGDFIESIEVKDGKEKKKPGLLFSLNPAPSFDMVIVDEAHHARNSETQTYKAVKFFCDNANAAVFLTATPLQLGNRDLFILLNLLRPDIVYDLPTFNEMAMPNGYINAAIHNLRIANEKKALEELENAVKTDWGRNVILPNPIYKETTAVLFKNEFTREQKVKLISDVESLHSFSGMINRTRRQDIEDFCVRRAYTLESEFTDAQRTLHDSLLEFVAEILSEVYPSMSLKFLMCTLRRQAASCIFGLAPSIQNITQRQISKLVEEYDFPEGIESIDVDSKYIEIFNEKSAHLIELANNLPNKDIKFEKLSELIREKQSNENNKIIVFTSFLHTIEYLFEKIKQMGDIRVRYVSGAVKDDDRYNYRERFAMPKEKTDALDILLFTEVGSEGLDYQFCDTIVNYDLPWNPMRIEQRIGRIDRRGQQSEVAHIYNCITEGTIDEEIHERCLKRIGIFESSIGDCSEILGELAKSIEEIILDPTLTKIERESKLEQLADNKVREIHEMQRLENEEKHFFGVDISTFTEDINKADNPWLSPEALHRLITGYLEKRLEPNKHMLTDNRLKLSQTEKSILFEDYRKLGYNKQDTIWISYLKSSSSVCRIAFDQDTAKDPKTLLINPMHPLVQQAANVYFSDNFSQFTIQTSSSDISPGCYPFQLYVWEYTGGKPTTRLFPICENAEAQKELPDIIQNSVLVDESTEKYISEWSKLEEIHLKLWQAEREKTKIEAESLYRFKIESLSNSISVRKHNAMNQIRETSDERIRIMREAEIARLDHEFSTKKNKFEEQARLADIHITLLVNGVLIVKEEVI